MKKYYMHTIGNMPAYYEKGKQIYYASRPSGVKGLAVSLRQIRKEQKLSIKWRMSQGFAEFENKYGYCIVRI